MTYQTEEASRRPLINTIQQASDKSNNSHVGFKETLNTSPAPRAQRLMHLPVATSTHFCLKCCFVLCVLIESSFCSLIDCPALWQSLCS